MAITEASVIKALSTVEDPDLKKDLVTLNMVKDVKVAGNRVSFTVVLTTPACPLKELIRQSCEDAIHQLVGKDLEVAINMTSNVTTTRENTPLLPDVKKYNRGSFWKRRRWKIYSCSQSCSFACQYRGKSWPN